MEVALGFLQAAHLSKHMKRSVQETVKCTDCEVSGISIQVLVTQSPSCLYYISYLSFPLYELHPLIFLPHVSAHSQQVQLYLVLLIPDLRRVSH